MLVYLPLMALEGVEGKMFRPMAITVAIALGGALLFTLTAFPAACAFALRSPKQRTHEGRGRVRSACGASTPRSLASRCGRRSCRCRGRRVRSVLADPAGGEPGRRVRAAAGRGRVRARRAPAAVGRISTAQRLSTQVEEVVARFPEAMSVVTRLGRAEVATEPVGVDETEVRVKLKPPRTSGPRAHDMDELGDKIEDRDRRRGAGDLRRDLAADRGSRQPAAVRLARGPGDQGVRRRPGRAQGDRRGDRRGRSRTCRARATCACSACWGCRCSTSSVDRLRLARHGIPAAEVLATVEAARAGIFAGKVFEGTRRFDITLLLPPPRAEPESIGEVPVGPADGVMRPAGAARHGPRRARGRPPSTARRWSGGCWSRPTSAGATWSATSNDARARVEAGVQLPQGYRLVWAGQFENFTRAKDRLVVVVPIALAIIFGMLFLMFGELRSALCVFACVPLAMVGGIVALSSATFRSRSRPRSASSRLRGVAVLNGVVMASEVQLRLERREGDGNPVHRQRGGVLRPVITTALVAAIGFMPMALSTRAGAEVQRPLATVVIGGILSSTLLRARCASCTLASAGCILIAQGSTPHDEGQNRAIPRYRAVRPAGARVARYRDRDRRASARSALSSLENTAAVTRVAVTQQLALIDDAAAMSAFQYQKGFVAEYLLSGNRELARRAADQPAGLRILARGARTRERSPIPASRAAARRHPARIRRVRSGAQDRRSHSTMRARSRGGARRRWREPRPVAAALRDLFHEFGRAATQDAERALADTEAERPPARPRPGRYQHRGRDRQPAGRVPVGAADHQADLRAGGAGSVVAERTRIQVAPGRAGLEALGDQVGALVEKLEETDAALAEHRRRLMQSEKLSAVGELAAKLAHEVLNPLAGMKAAVQLLARQGRGRAADGGEVRRDRGGAEPRDHAGRGAGPAAGRFLPPARAPGRGRDGRHPCSTRRLDAAQPALMRHAVSGRATARSRTCCPSRSTRCCSRRCWSTCW